MAMATCGTCWRYFSAGGNARQQHLDAKGHSIPQFECETCFSYFGSRRAVCQHMNDARHWAASPDPECDFCDESFYNESDLRDHEINDHIFCRPCNRHFQNRNNITQHLRSRAHCSTTVQCPFCPKTFGTATGLVHHLERGACPSAPLDRDTLYRVVRRYDPNGILCKKLLTWSGSSTFEASQMAWNSRAQAYECYLCHRLFPTLPSLNQHLNSPVHQESLYHCPGCPKEFTTLAAVINHLESESCQYTRFEDVQQGIQRIVNPCRMIQGI
ncbi:hypothetical protein CDD82_6168 [Ophiocordyceps australis]|uniref:C2H2-type domain-containing protein n=1 Tax=Ophiocordyceps australis TaxID=1399860 RepID=A0A2C5YX84_9HYPO|nr:hypothetical protein CDD82_6168 [Ophiocordyceps australis]